MKLFSLLPLLVLTSLATACGSCVARKAATTPEQGSIGSDAASATAAKSARIQGEWQDQLKTKAAEAKADEAWGLFSASGYADDGQIMVQRKGEVYTVTIVKPSQKAAEAARALSAKEAENMKGVTTLADALLDLESDTFDGVQYEYAHVVLKGDQGQFTKRVYMNSPNKAKNGERHVAVITGFQALR